MKCYYITTTLPYVNADPHIGFALEIVTADTLARFHRLQGESVVFNTGTDEHGLKIYRKSTELHQSPQQYVDGYAEKFKVLKNQLNLSITHFVRTTDPHHIQAAQTFWQHCVDAGDIYKKAYRVKYCVGCELEKTESELVDNKCPLHPNLELEIIEEENYFFRFSRYQQPLLDLYHSHPDFVRPESKYKEILAFIEHGLQDFSVSRLKTKLPWGIEVPEDPDHVMYVWFDALVNYISTLGWPENTTQFSQCWPGVQIAGKDNLRQQAAMWQAMLLSAGIVPSKQILINGFISVEGQKMSKSTGNVIAPTDMIKRYGIDGTRYLLLFLGPVSTDMDVSLKQFDDWYNAYLANSLGNTVQRIATLCARSGFEFLPSQSLTLSLEVKEALNSYQFTAALTVIWNRIKTLEKHIDDVKPWTLSGDPLQEFLTEAVMHMRQIGFELQPFLPTTAQTILDIFTGPTIHTSLPLFPRLQMQ